MRTLKLLSALLVVFYLGLKIVNACSASNTMPTNSKQLSDSLSGCGQNSCESQTGGSAVTSIQIYTTDTAKTQIQAFQVNNIGDVTPNRAGCTSPSPGCPVPTLYATLYLAPSTTITKIETWNKQRKICKISFTVSNSSIYTYTSSAENNQNSCTKETANFDSQNQFVGFWGRGQCSGCTSECLVAQRYTPPITCSNDTISSIDVSSFNGGSLTLGAGAAQTKTLSATTSASLTTCTINYQITVTPVGPCTSLITLSGSTLTFATSNDFTNAAVCSIAVQASIGGQSSTVWSSYSTGTFTFIDPCSQATLKNSTMPNINVNVGQTSSQTATVSDSYTSSTGSPTPLCALTSSFSMVKSNVTSSIILKQMIGQITFTASSGLLTMSASSTSTSEIGWYSIQIIVCLTSRSSQCVRQFVRVTVIPASCTISTVSILQDNPVGVLSDQIWTIQNLAQFQLQLTVDTSSTCGYTPTSWTITTTSIDSTQVNQFQTISSSGLFQAGPFYDLQTVGTYTISVTSVTLNGNLYTSIQNITTPCFFKLTVVDPCLSTAISGPKLSIDISVQTSIQNFIAFSGYSQQSSYNYTFNDTVSLTWSQIKQFQDFCGNKTFKFFIGLQTTTLVTGSNNQSIIFTPPENSTQYGTQQVVLQVCMQRYTTICSSYEFSITTLGISAPVITQQLYVVADQALNFTFYPFQILPTDYKFDPLVVNTLSAYILTTATPIVKPFNINSQNLVPISEKSWIDFNQTSRQFSVSTTDNAFSGNYSIVVANSFDQFPDVISYTQFILLINKTTPQPPYFKPPLTDLVVVQCPGDQNKLWSYLIPTPVNPNNQQVLVQVTINSKFFTYNSQSKTIMQNKIQIPMNLTIDIHLSDKLNATANYTMLVEFKCNQTSNLTFNLTTKQKSVQNVRNQTFWPTAYIRQVDSDGLMHIAFNQIMKIPEHPEDIQNQTLNINGTDYPILQIKVIPGQLSDLKKLKFNWTFEKFTKTALIIQINFENEYYVSSRSGYLDKIQVEIYGNYYFADTRANFMLPGTVLNQKILPQLAPKNAIERIQAQGEAAKNILTSALVSNTIISVLIAGPLNQILGTIKQLQIIMHLMLVNVAFPATATIFFGILMQCLTFQVFDFTNFYNSILNFDNEGLVPFTNQFNSMGYSSRYIVQNFGVLCWSLLITPIVWLFTPFIVFLSRGQLSNWKIKVSRQMFFNNWIQLINETYLFFGVCVALNSFYFHFNSFGNAINSLWMIIFAFTTLSFPFFVLLFYTRPKNFEKILQNDQDFMGRYGSILEGLNIKQIGRKVFIYSFISLLRKLSLIYVVVYLQEYPVLSLFAINYQAIIMITVVGYMPPFEDKFLNQMELLNEVFVLLTNYHMLTFTDFQPDLKTRQLLGQSLIITTVVIILVNIGGGTLINLFVVLRKLKLKFLELRYAIKVKERRKQIELERQHKQLELDQQQKKQKVQAYIQSRYGVSQVAFQSFSQNQPGHQKTQQNQEPKNLFNGHVISKSQSQSQFVTIDTKQAPKKIISENQLLFGGVATQKVKLQGGSFGGKNQTNQIQQGTNSALGTAWQNQTGINEQIKKNNQHRLQLSDLNPQNKPNAQQEHIAGLLKKYDKYIQKVENSLKLLPNRHSLTIAQINSHIESLFPGEVLEGIIYTHFYPKSDQDKLRLQLNLDEYIFQEIEKGNLDRELRKYAQMREYLSYQDKGADDEQKMYKAMDLGEYSPNMTLYEQGQLYYQIAHFKAKWKVYGNSVLGSDRF